MIGAVRSRSKEGRPRRAVRAVSLFELMVVIAVAGILTIFFIYSSQYLMVSTRISRVKEEHRILKRALHNYEADYGSFPDTSAGLHVLDGPVAYLLRVPMDPFSNENEEYVYVALPGGSYRWVVLSRGPDGDSDLLEALGLSSKNGLVVVAESGDEANTIPVRAEQIDTFLTILSYDPTNGLISDGDIITTSR